METRSGGGQTPLGSGEQVGEAGIPGQGCVRACICVRAVREHRAAFFFFFF